MPSPLLNSSKLPQRLRTKGGEIIDLCGISAEYRSKIREEIERGERDVVEAEPFEAPLSRNADKFTSSDSNIETPIATSTLKPTSGGDGMKFPAWIEDRCTLLAEECTTRMHANGPTYGTRAEVKAKFDAAWKLANEFLARNEDGTVKGNEEEET